MFFVAQRNVMLTSLTFTFICMASTSPMTLHRPHDDVTTIGPTHGTIVDGVDSRLSREIQNIRILSENRAYPLGTGDVRQTSTVAATTTSPRQRIKRPTAATTVATSAPSGKPMTKFTTKKTTNGIERNLSKGRRMREHVGSAMRTDVMHELRTGAVDIMEPHRTEGHYPSSSGLQDHDRKVSRGAPKADDMSKARMSHVQPSPGHRIAIASNYVPTRRSHEHSQSPMIGTQGAVEQQMIVPWGRDTERPQVPDVIPIEARDVAWSNASTESAPIIQKQQENLKTNNDGNTSVERRMASALVASNGNEGIGAREDVMGRRQFGKNGADGPGSAAAESAHSNSTAAGSAGEHRDVEENDEEGSGIEGRQGSEYYENYEYQTNTGDVDDNVHNDDEVEEQVEVVRNRRRPSKKTNKKKARKPVEPVGQVHEERPGTQRKKQKKKPPSAAPVKRRRGNRSKKQKAVRSQSLLPSASGAGLPASAFVQQAGSQAVPNFGRVEPSSPHQQPFHQQQQQQQQHHHHHQQQQQQQQHQQQQQQFVQLQPSAGASDGSAFFLLPQGAADFSSALLPRQPYLDPSIALIGDGGPVHGGLFHVSSNARQADFDYSGGSGNAGDRHQSTHHEQPVQSNLVLADQLSGAVPLFDDGAAGHQFGVASVSTREGSQHPVSSDQRLAVADGPSLPPTRSSHTPQFHLVPHEDDNPSDVPDRDGESDEDRPETEGRAGTKRKIRRQPEVVSADSGDTEQSTKGTRGSRTAKHRQLSSASDNKKEEEDGPSNDANAAENEAATDDEGEAATASGSAYDWSQIKTGFEDDTGSADDADQQQNSDGEVNSDEEKQGTQTENDDDADDDDDDDDDDADNKKHKNGASRQKQPNVAATTPYYVAPPSATIAELKPAEALSAATAGDKAVKESKGDSTQRKTANDDSISRGNNATANGEQKSSSVASLYLSGRDAAAATTTAASTSTPHTGAGQSAADARSSPAEFDRSINSQSISVTKRKHLDAGAVDFTKFVEAETTTASRSSSQRAETTTPTWIAHLT
jgi:hypothetical protein